MRNPMLALAVVFSFVAIGVAQSGEISGSVVKVGVLTYMSGPYADNVGAGSILAAQMAAGDFGGKVNGARIEIVSSGFALAVQAISSEKRQVFFLAIGPGTPDLTGKNCSPVGVHWAYDNCALGNVVAGAAVRRG